MAVMGNFVLMALVLGGLLFFSLLTAFVNNFIYFPLLFFAVLGFLFRYAKELKEKIIPKISREDLLLILCVLGGTVITFLLNNHLELGSIIPAALVGLVAALFAGKKAGPIYCGAFVGMACQEVSGTFYSILLAGLLAGGLFVLNKNHFNGFGGKLGILAFTGCLVVFFLRGEEFSSLIIEGSRLKWMIVFYSVLGAVLTYFGSFRLNQGPVLSSALTGLVGGIILPSIFPEVGLLLAGAMFCGAFVGMSSPERLPNEGFIVIAAIFAGIFFVYSSSYLGGTGGKLGAIAFISTIGVRGLADLYLQFWVPYRIKVVSLLLKNL